MLIPECWRVMAGWKSAGDLCRRNIIKALAAACLSGWLLDLSGTKKPRTTNSRRHNKRSLPPKKGEAPSGCGTPGQACKWASLICGIFWDAFSGRLLGWCEVRRRGNGRRDVALSVFIISRCPSTSLYLKAKIKWCGNYCSRKISLVHISKLNARNNDKILLWYMITATNTSHNSHNKNHFQIS